ncbi:Glyceraldehyde-3-phosphate dehydrogenase GAPA1, chloroplastic [Senna tora]|uniref:Glyceraldehyde-3-phosphate dehydrogenase GAPA1, chloroplastic n=1 Tax=Senna tora TaxID=362788 RepID=A0A834TZX2_9FABA|nr:Glyceraldehyde-3-phosphate dehydrogenase GAPA1, chloroplastic [Senna tora]
MTLTKGARQLVVQEVLLMMGLPWLYVSVGIDTNDIGAIVERPAHPKGQSRLTKLKMMGRPTKLMGQEEMTRRPSSPKDRDKLVKLKMMGRPRPSKGAK